MYEYIYLGHDNIIDLLLTADDEIVDITNTTRATAEFGDTVIDSDTSALAFDWSEGDGILHLIMGEETIPTGSYKAVITLYDVVNTDGIVWDDFRCRVVGEDLVPIPDTPPPVLISQGGTGQSTAHAAFNALKQIATETYTGVTELATTDECVTGTDTSRAITPAGLTARMESPGNIGGTVSAEGKFAVGHFGDDADYSEFLSDGKLHFAGDARPVNIVAVTGAQLVPSHHNPLCITSLAVADGILTSGLDTATGASRRIEVQGINGGVYVKGRIKNVYSQEDTTNHSEVIKIKLNTTNATWEQSGEWQIVLDITDGCVDGNFTVFMPPFSLMEYSDYSVYVTEEGATYFESAPMGFAQSLAGPTAASEDFSNDEVAGSNVVVEVADTTGFCEGNLVFVSDSENSEWGRIKTIVTNTSITIYELTNSYTTANGAKFDIFNFTQTAETSPIQRGLLKMKTFRSGVNSGIEFQYAIPHTIDDDVELGIVIQYVGTDTNVGEDVSKWRAQWALWEMFTSVDQSRQYGNLVYADVTPPATKINTIATLATISGADHAGKHVLAVQIARLGSDASDTYTGDIKVVGIAMTHTSDKLGYEV